MLFMMWLRATTKFCFFHILNTINGAKVALPMIAATLLAATVARTAAADLVPFLWPTTLHGPLCLAVGPVRRELERPLRSRRPTG